MPCSVQLDKEPIGTSAPESEAGALVVRRHHLLVRCSHWLNVPILLGLMLSGMSIYWASPVYQQETDPLTAGWSTKGGEIEGLFKMNLEDQDSALETAAKH